MSGTSSDSMEQVRELLMGTQLKDMESRLGSQEARLMREIADVGDSLKERLKSLENFMNSETASLLHRLQEEQACRAEAVKAEQRERGEALAQLSAELTKEWASRAEGLEQRLSVLSGTLDTAERELRQLLQAENGRLSEKIDEKYKDALNMLTRVSAELRGELISRSSLAGIFTEAAVKVSGQWYLDGSASEAARLESDDRDSGEDEA